MRKVLVISTHLDDGILSAGQFMAGRPDTDLLTVFAGIPPDPDLLTDYDRACGFSSSKEAMEVRRAENNEACAILHATPLYLDNYDSQYIVPVNGINNVIQDLYEVRDIIEAGDYEMVIAPLGLRHPDHLLVSELCLMLKLPNLYLYEDLPARVTHPELVQKRLADIEEYTPELTFIGDGPIQDKVRSLWCYRSQICRGDLTPYNLYVPERFHHVTA